MHIPSKTRMGEHNVERERERACVLTSVTYSHAFASYGSTAFLVRQYGLRDTALRRHLRLFLWAPRRIRKFATHRLQSVTAMSDPVDAPPVAAIPTNARARQLRACLLCSIIQSPAEFKRNGCPNCEEIMQMKQSQDRVASCTTTHFDGVIAVIDPESSWVARWQRTCVFFYNFNSN